LLQHAELPINAVKMATLILTDLDPNQNHSLDHQGTQEIADKLWPQMEACFDGAKDRTPWTDGCSAPFEPMTQVLDPNQNHSLDHQFKKEETQEIADKLWPQMEARFDGAKDRMPCTDGRSAPSERMTLRPTAPIRAPPARHGKGVWQSEKQAVSNDRHFFEGSL
jgi:hypothetical protein